MSLFIVFILAAVLLGAGAMLSPAWRSAQPRIALAATLCLGLVVGGAVFYAETFGWDTLVVDYLLFALLSGVVLGGTLSTAQARAEARGERLADRDQGWPGPGDLALFAFVALLLLLPLIHLSAPLGEQGQIVGFHSLAARDGGSFNALPPHYPPATVVVSPGFHALSAYLSSQLDQSIPVIQLSVSAVVALLLVWLAYDFGAEFHDKRLGRALAVASLLCVSLTRSTLDGHFAELMALLFMGAFTLYALRLARRFSLADLIAAGLMMGAVAITSLSVSLATLLGWIALLATNWKRRRDEPAASSAWALAFGVPVVALLGIAPWLVNNLPQLSQISPSPYPAAPANLALIVRDHGVVIVFLALWGINIGLRAPGIQRFLSRLMLLWLLLIIEMTCIGLIGGLLPPLRALTNAPNLARHGLILPLAWFAGIALLNLWEAYLPADLKRRLQDAVYPALAIAAALLLTLALAFQPLLAALGFPPPALNRDDVAAMVWLRDNTPSDAVVMSADGKAWLPVIAERRAIDYKALRYFEWGLINKVEAEPIEADYVFAPAGALPPAEESLSLVFSQGHARVYEALPNLVDESD